MRRGDDVVPLSPEQIDAVLEDSDRYELKCTEAAEREVSSMFRAIAEQVGVDAYLEMIIPMMLKEEERWRREVPDHPGLRVIEQWRETKPL